MKIDRRRWITDGRWRVRLGGKPVKQQRKLMRGGVTQPITGAQLGKRFP